MLARIFFLIHSCTFSLQASAYGLPGVSNIPIGLLPWLLGAAFVAVASARPLCWRRRNSRSTLSSRSASHRHRRRSEQTVPK